MMLWLIVISILIVVIFTLKLLLPPFVVFIQGPGWLISNGQETYLTDYESLFFHWGKFVSGVVGKKIPIEIEFKSADKEQGISFYLIMTVQEEMPLSVFSSVVQQTRNDLELILREMLEHASVDEIRQYLQNLKSPSEKIEIRAEDIFFGWPFFRPTESSLTDPFM